MRLIDLRWTDLSLGFQAIKAHQTQLENEFGRALAVGSKQQYRRELSDWQSKRRIFFALVALAPLSIIALCITAYYEREVACVLAWWILTVLLVIITLLVAGWSYIHQMVNGKPTQPRAHERLSLLDLWWQVISFRPSASTPQRKNAPVKLQAMLERDLADEWLAVSDLFPMEPPLAGGSLLLLGPGGIWLFEDRTWNGMIIKPEKTWQLVKKKVLEPAPGAAPDELWTRQVEQIRSIIRTHLPHLAWTVDMIQGGVAFTQLKEKIDRSRIKSSTASYGPSSAWAKRLRLYPPDQRFTIEVQLEVLDALITWSNRREEGGMVFASSREEADRLFEQVSTQLWEEIARMVK